MSALPDEPFHFLRWLEARNWPGAAPGLFAPRRVYGEYLGELLRQFQVKMPFTLEGRLTAKLHTDIPVDQATDIKL